MAAPILLLQDIHLSFGRTTVLDGAELSVGAGERLCLVGRNGSGKSTFLKILAGLHTPDRGTVSKRRDLIVSYLSQDFTLDPARDIRANIRAGAQHVLETEAVSGATTRHGTPSWTHSSWTQPANVHASITTTPGR
jgi:ATPase subunit of ABC transporter with duplicated ATPase domains